MSTSTLLRRGFSSTARRPVRKLQRVDSINSGTALNAPAPAEPESVTKQNERTATRVRASLVGGSVHGRRERIEWQTRPLFRRAGKSVNFTSGAEAAKLLSQEARRRDPYQVDFLECLDEVLADVAPVFESSPKSAWVFKQLMEPERLIQFRVPWTDENGNARINRGFRIQYSSALGRYRGGLRFSPHMSHGSCRMLGMEQTLKNALSGVGFGGAKGGSDFDPVNKSEADVRNFCASFITELAPFIGPELDTVEGDLGVGPTELGWMRGQYNRNHRGAVSGGADAELFGSDMFFPEATGFGCVHFADRALQASGIAADGVRGQRCMLSGKGQVALSTAQKLIELGAVPVTMSSHEGHLHDPDGIDAEKLALVAELGPDESLRAYVEQYPSARFIEFGEGEGGSMWEQHSADLAFPCIMQNEIGTEDAAALARNGCKAVVECADRACSTTAASTLTDAGVLLCPGKATNVGSVIVSAFEHGDVDELDAELRVAMVDLHDRVVDSAVSFGKEPTDLRAGANILSFQTIAAAMVEQGSL